jgi:hypothetical protein
MTAGYVILGMTESDYTALKTAAEIYFKYESELIEALSVALRQGWDISLGGLKNICKVADTWEGTERVAYLQKVFGRGGSTMYMLVGRIQE